VSRTAGLAAAAVLLVAALLLSLGVGPVAIGPGRILDVVEATVAAGGRAALPPEYGRDASILFDVRAPRTVLGALVGASIALAGAVMQGVFRNPLADPGLIGVSAGAAVAAFAWIILGEPLASLLPPFAAALALPLAAFAGGLGTTLLLARVATRDGRTDISVMLLAGVALGALASAATGALVFMARDDQLRAFLFWTLGSLGGASWLKIALATPFALLLCLLAPRLARGLDAVALGERQAFHAGIDVERLKRIAVLAVAAAVAAAVASAGAIGFIGLVVPHIVRMAIGPSHGTLLPASALLGAALLLFSDLGARMAVAPAEMPISALTAAFGAPFFLWLLTRRRGRSFG
jgi:iron complex transport system permease protein